MHTAPALPWAFNARLVLTLGDRRIYRSAAPELRGPELEEPPAGVLWVDLRSPHERVDKEWLGDEWTRAEIDLIPGVAAVKPGTHTYEVLSKIDFGAMYVQMVERAQERFARVVTTIAEAETDVLVACAGGRDRTGLVSAMLRDLAGHDRATILADYERTNEAGDGLWDAMVRAGLVAPGMLSGGSFPVLPKDLALALDAIDAKGGTRRYLEDGGASAATLDLLSTAVVTTH